MLFLDVDPGKFLTGHCLESKSLASVSMDQDRMKEVMPYLTFSHVNFGLKKQIEVGKVWAA